MTYEYPRAVRGPLFQDGALVGAWAVLLACTDMPLRARVLLLVAIPIVLAWGAVSLHFPARVVVDAQGVAFWRYGRVHRFAWADVERIRVRRFLVRDRVLVRIEPSGGAWRGRYWILDSIDSFDTVVGQFTARAALRTSN
jgi:hypothetical protein